MRCLVTYCHFSVKELLRERKHTEEVLIDRWHLNRFCGRRINHVDYLGSTLYNVHPL